MSDNYEPGIYLVEYICIDDGARYPEDAAEVKSVYYIEPRMASHFARLVAEKCAEHYHYATEGSWADAWPKTFELYKDGSIIGKYEVSRQPSFFAQIYSPTAKGESA